MWHTRIFPRREDATSQIFTPPFLTLLGATVSWCSWPAFTFLGFFLCYLFCHLLYPWRLLWREPIEHWLESLYSGSWWILSCLSIFSGDSAHHWIWNKDANHGVFGGSACGFFSGKNSRIPCFIFSYICLGCTWLFDPGLHGWSCVLQTIKTTTQNKDSHLQPASCHHFEEQKALPDFQDWRS